MILDGRLIKMVERSIGCDGGEASYFEVPSTNSQSSTVSPKSPVRFSQSSNVSLKSPVRSESQLLDECGLDSSFGSGSFVMSTPERKERYF